MTDNVKHLPTDCDHWLIISETPQITQASAAPRQHFGNVAKKAGLPNSFQQRLRHFGCSKKLHEKNTADRWRRRRRRNGLNFLAAVAFVQSAASNHFSREQICASICAQPWPAEKNKKPADVWLKASFPHFLSHANHVSEAKVLAFIMYSYLR